MPDRPLGADDLSAKARQILVSAGIYQPTWLCAAGGLAGMGFGAQQRPHGVVGSAGMTMSRLTILPVGPLGSVSAIHTWRGSLYAATWPLT